MTNPFPDGCVVSYRGGTNRYEVRASTESEEYGTLWVLRRIGQPYVFSALAEELQMIDEKMTTQDLLLCWADQYGVSDKALKALQQEFSVQARET